MFRSEQRVKKRKTHTFFVALQFSIEWRKICKKRFYCIFALRASCLIYLPVIYLYLEEKIVQVCATFNKM